MTTNAKLAECETKLRRWHSRLARAANMVGKLERQRRRLSLGTPPAAPAKAKKATAPAEVTAPKAAVAVADGIPDFLDRSDPLIAERMTAARKAAEANERKKMPLTGRAALDYVKATKRPRAASRKASASQAPLQS